MMEKKSSSTIYTKENIVEAFWKCYEGKKISEVTVKDIMKTAGYNRSTFYQYFDDVNDLLLYAEERLLEQLKKDIEDTLVQGASEIVMEKALNKCFEEFGIKLAILLGPKGDANFFTTFKEILRPLALYLVKTKTNLNDIDLLCEFAGYDVISMILYVYDHPEADRKHVIRKLNAYIHGGAQRICRKTSTH